MKVSSSSTSPPFVSWTKSAAAVCLLLLLTTASGPPNNNERHHSSMFASAEEATTSCSEHDLVVTPQSKLQSMLPPSPFWNSTKSMTEFVLADETSSLMTPAEATNFTETATYEEVTDFFTELATQYPSMVDVKSLMKFQRGEDLWLVTVSTESFDPSIMTRPVIYITAGIHPGESSGVNAGMMFVRNLVTDPNLNELLDFVNVLFVPIFNVEGYLRQSPNGRINQHGPNTSGRRGNGKNQNLNRDFSKLTNAETRAVVSIFNDYNVAFYTDLHSTDGLNYQDDVTWCDNGAAGLSNAIHTWLRTEMEPSLSDFLVQYGHSPGPCYYANDGMDPTAGFYPYLSDGTEYSTNYADHRQVPAYLLEIHALKPNHQRVLGAYAYLYGLTTIIANKTDSLLPAIATDQAARVDPVPITWDYDDPPPMYNWTVFEYDVVTNPTFGVDQIIWSDTPLTIEVENSVRSTPFNAPRRPDFYYIPAVWTEVIETLTAHGIVYETLAEDVTLEVVNYRMEDFESPSTREGRATGSGTPVPERCARTYRVNDIRIPTDQPLGTLAVALLEPTGEQSFFFYGFFNSVFSQNEYGENYIMLPIAEFMLETYPEITAEWETFVEFKPDYSESDVVDWFFKKTAFYDQDAFVYPVGILYPEDYVNSPEYIQETGVCPDPIVIPPEQLQSLLPPSPEWDDSSVAEYIVGSDNPLITPAELSNFTETATYDEISQFFSDLAAESEFVRVESLMKFANGEDLWLVKVSGEQAFTPEDMTNPIFYATAAIHPGESSGVNAGMMFLRNLVTDPNYSDLLNSINILFIPVFNVQGYLRQSESGRINQYGPRTSGRRGNFKNENLNRDFSKLTNPETRAVVNVMNEYDIAFYTDLHSTDGMNYQDDVTWCDNGDAGLSNSIHAWLRGTMEPALYKFLEEYNHSPGPCFYANDNLDPTAGFYPYLSDGTEYSTNYADHRQIPAYLLEIHSLKPNKQRVLGAYSYLHGVTSIIANNSESLMTAIAEDQAARIDPVPIAWDYDQPPPMFNWSIFEYSVVINPTFNVDQIIWTDIPLTIEVENSVRSTPFDPPNRPIFYYIPAVWVHVIDTLSAHGIQFDVLEEDVTIEGIVNYRIEDFASTRVREGRAVGSGTPIPEACTRTYRKNDIRVPTDQPLGTLAVALLEPTGEQSFFFYGFFNSVFAQNEYGENYIMIPLAEELYRDDSVLAAEWDEYVATENPEFTESDVVDFFFRRTAFYDSEAFVYPVGIFYGDNPDVTPTPQPPSTTDSPTTAPPTEAPIDGSDAATTGTVMADVLIMITVFMVPLALYDVF